MAEMILTASLMIVVGVLLRVLAIHRLPKLLFVVIWGLVSFRLLVPFSLPEAFRVLNLAVIPLPEFGAVAPAFPQWEQVSAGVDWTFALGALWALGSVSLAGYFFVTHYRFRREMCASLPVEHPFIANWFGAKRSFRKVRVRQSDRIRSPLTYGIFRPVILLPATLDLEDEGRLNYVLTHEYIHVKRLDYVWKFVFAAVLCVHWFNPLVWLMYMLTNRDIELSCDETVLRICGQKSKAAYGMILLDLAEGRGRSSFADTHFSKHSLEERICVMVRGGRRSVMGAIVALVLVLGAMTVFVYASDAPLHFVQRGASFVYAPFRSTDPVGAPADVQPLAEAALPSRATQGRRTGASSPEMTVALLGQSASVAPLPPECPPLEECPPTAYPSVEEDSPFERPPFEVYPPSEWPPIGVCPPFERPPFGEERPCEWPPLEEYPPFGEDSPVERQPLEDCDICIDVFCNKSPVRP